MQSLNIPLLWMNPRSSGCSVPSRAGPVSYPAGRGLCQREWQERHYHVCTLCLCAAARLPPPCSSKGFCMVPPPFCLHEVVHQPFPTSAELYVCSFFSKASSATTFQNQQSTMSTNTGLQVCLHSQLNTHKSILLVDITEGFLHKYKEILKK